MSLCLFFFFKQKTAYEMRISDWSSDVCSSDLCGLAPDHTGNMDTLARREVPAECLGIFAFGHIVNFVMNRGFQFCYQCAQIHPLADWLIAHQIGRASCRERVCQYV